MAGAPASSGKTEDIVAATFKVLVLGNSDVGKTSLIQRYASGKVQNNLLPTIGIDFSDVVINAKGTRVKLRIWDTAGQEKFHTFTKQFFRGTQGILLMYDITSMRSFQTLQKWLSTIHDEGLEGVTVVLVGNKADMAEDREVPLESGEKIAMSHGYQYIETSAYTGTNVKKAFLRLAELLLQDHGIFIPGAAYVSSTVDAQETDELIGQSFKLDFSFSQQITTKKKCCS